LKNHTKPTFLTYVKGKLATLAIKSAGALPPSLTKRLGKLLGLLLLKLNTREVKIARRNLDICFPELDQVKKQALLRSTFIHSGMQVFEIAYLWCSSSDKGIELIKAIQGEETLNEAIKQQKGVLLILPHLGNWEMINAYLVKKLGMPIMAMYSPAQMPAVDAIMREGRARTGLDLAEANSRGVIQLIQRLKAGGNLAILPDQEPDRSGGEFALFFGIEALTMTLISKMLLKTQAIPIVVYAERLENSLGFKLHFKKVDPAIQNENITTSLVALNKTVEDTIKECPEQYMWGYKRFRKRPEGQENLYKDLT
jgi:KDO2-lipid IV(A) lauroyltransferase